MTPEEQEAFANLICRQLNSMLEESGTLAAINAFLQCRIDVTGLPSSSSLTVQTHPDGSDSLGLMGVLNGILRSCAEVDGEQPHILMSSFVMLNGETELKEFFVVKEDQAGLVQKNSVHVNSEPPVTYKNWVYDEEGRAGFLMSINPILIDYGDEIGIETRDNFNGLTPLAHRGPVSKLVGRRVVHDTQGHGEIASHQNDKVMVRFKGKARMFPYPCEELRLLERTPEEC